MNNYNQQPPPQQQMQPQQMNNAYGHGTTHNNNTNMPMQIQMTSMQQNAMYAPPPQQQQQQQQQPGAVQPGQPCQPGGVQPGGLPGSIPQTRLQHSLSHELVSEHNMARVSDEDILKHQIMLNNNNHNPNTHNHGHNNNMMHGSKTPPPPDHSQLQPNMRPVSPAASVQGVLFGAYEGQAQGQAQAQNAAGMVVGGAGSKCSYSGCRCKEYKESHSKWNKGKCKTCNHSETEHNGPSAAAFSYDSHKMAKAPPSQTLPPKPALQRNQQAPQNQNLMPQSSKPMLGVSHSVKVGASHSRPISPRNHQHNFQNHNHNYQNPNGNANNNVNAMAQHPNLQLNRSASMSDPHSNNNNMGQSAANSNGGGGGPPMQQQQLQRKNTAKRAWPSSPRKGALPAMPAAASTSNNNHHNNNANKNSLPDLASKLSGVPGLQMASNVQAKNKESAYMDMTIAEVVRLQNQQGSKMNIPLANLNNLDRNMTVRQIIEQNAQNKQPQKQANAILNALNNNNGAAAQPPPKDPWASSNAWNTALGANAHEDDHADANQQNQNQNQNYQPQQAPPQQQPQHPQLQQNPGSFSTQTRQPNGSFHQQYAPPLPHQQQQQQHHPPHQQQQRQAPNMRQQHAHRSRTYSDARSSSYQPPQPQQQRQQQQQHNGYHQPQQQPQQTFHPPPPNFNSTHRPPPKAFQAMQGFQPAAAGGLTARNVGQKMGTKTLQHRDIQQPHQNPWDRNTASGAAPNFKNKTYNKKEHRQRAQQRAQQQQQQQQQPTTTYQQSMMQDGTQYDSDESVFVTQANLARRHSTGSSSLEPSAVQQPFGKPISVQQEQQSPQQQQQQQARSPAQQAALVESLCLTEKEFYKKYWIEEDELGKGSFAKVRKVTRKADGDIFALKMIKKAGKSAEDLVALQREIAILAKLNHENVVKLMDWCETKKRIYMVVQFCDGGDVFERILKQKTFSEKEAAHVVRKVAEGLRHVHDNHIIHRDLKPDNLMYLTKDATSNIMIIDFGLAGDASHGPLSTPCGTAHYVAPEVLSGKAYNGKADMWSLGVIIYMLLCGFPPFFDAQGNQKRLYKLIKLGKYRFPSPYWDYVSEPAKDLIKQLLTLDVEKRLSAQQVMAHKWVNPTPDVQHMDLGKMYMEQMEHFSSSRHFVDAGMKIHGNVPAPPPQFAYFKDTQHAPKYNNKNNDDDGDDGDDDNDDSDTDDDW